MAIYLAGPYTSRSFEEHKINIGRLLTFYIHCHPMTKQPIICPPLESAGFDNSNELSSIDWIQKCLDLVKVADQIWLVPGHLSSHGCQMECKTAEYHGISKEEIKLPTTSEYIDILQVLSKIWSYNPFTTWARDYILINWNLFP